VNEHRHAAACCAPNLRGSQSCVRLRGCAALRQRRSPFTSARDLNLEQWCLLTCNTDDTYRASQPRITACCEEATVTPRIIWRHCAPRSRDNRVGLESTAIRGESARFDEPGFQFFHGIVRLSFYFSAIPQARSRLCVPCLLYDLSNLGPLRSSRACTGALFNSRSASADNQPRGSGESCRRILPRRRIVSR